MSSFPLLLHDISSAIHMATFPTAIYFTFPLCYLLHIFPSAIYFTFSLSTVSFLTSLSAIYLRRRVCCRFRIEGFVSKACGRLCFLPLAIAAAAAIPMVPVGIRFDQIIIQ